MENGFYFFEEDLEMELQEEEVPFGERFEPGVDDDPLPDFERIPVVPVEEIAFGGEEFELGLLENPELVEAAPMDVAEAVENIGVIQIEVNNEFLQRAEGRVLHVDIEIGGPVRREEDLDSGYESDA